MREVVIGTAGHVDHGKTSLVRALTGIDTDRLKEEKERGITIELGFAFLDLPCGHRLGIVDVPGHERFVKNMVAGAAGMDLVAFIVAADEGIMPQTREHFEICRLLGLKRGLVIITKKDMVEPEWLEMVKEEVREFFAGSFLADAPLLSVSSTSGDGLGEVRDTLNQMVGSLDFAEAHGPFRMPVDRVFSMKGFGAVVTGTSVSGRIRVGDEITIYPEMTSAKIRGIQVHSQDVDMVEAGHRTAINIQNLEKEEISRGNLIASPGCLQPSFLLDADFLYISSNKKPLKNRTRIRLHLGTAEVMARIVLLEDEELGPGGEANVQIITEEPVTAWPNDRYVVRSYSPVATIGGGAILNSSPPKRRRFKEANREIFKIYHSGEPEKLARLHIREAGHTGLTFDQLALKTGLFGKRLKKILDGPLSAREIVVVEADKQRMVAREVYDNLSAGILQRLESYHADNPLQDGLSKEELRSRLAKDLDHRLFQLLVNDLVKRQLIVQDQAIIRLASHRVALKADEESLRRKMDSFYHDAGLTPPTVKELLTQFPDFPAEMVKEIIAVMLRNGVLIKVKEDLLFDGRAIEELQEKMRAFMQQEGEIDAPRFKTMTGLSRKFTIPLLEYFDRIKMTIRVGDKRVLREMK